MRRPFALLLAAIFMAVLYGCDEVPDPSLPNEPPVAMDDNISLKQNEVSFVDLLDNDVDIDGDFLLVEITQDPVNGTLEETESGFFYTPELYFIGTDEFVYQITDLVGHIATATVSLEIQKKEVRAAFAVTDGTDERVFLLDSRDPGTLIDLAQAVPAGESVINWDISEELQLAVFLTDADRVLTVSLDDPATLVDEFEVDTTSGAIDGELSLSNAGFTAIVGLANRYLFALGLEDGDTLEIDTGFDSGSTMTPSFFSPLDTSLVMQGTLGADADERSAIYLVPLSTLAPIQILDDPAILDSTFTRLLGGLNSMLWLTGDSTATIPPAAYSCAAPPSQIYSAPSYTQLGVPDAGVDLIEASGVLPDPTDIISYNNSADTDGLFVAACPSEAEIFQIVEIPYLDPASARIVTSADDVSDGLWNIDVGPDGNRLIYALEGDTGLRVMSVDLAGDDPAVTDLTASVAGYQTYTSGMELRTPPSLISADGLRWVFLAPVDDVLNRLVWLQLETAELTTVDLPFTATNLVSDGLFVIVQGETAGAGSAPVALIELTDPQIDPVDVPGSLVETVVDPLNQIESAIRLIDVP